MCLIVDEDVAGLVFGADAGFAPVRRWLFQAKDGTLVLGGEHRKKLLKMTRLVDALAELESAGRIVRRNDGVVDAEQKRVTRMQLQSRDFAVLALARESGARVLASNDVDLMHDFKNPLVIPSPRGKVFTTVRRGGQRRAPEGVLGHCRGCPRQPRA
jgi:hypothetical protein